MSAHPFFGTPTITGRPELTTSVRRRKIVTGHPGYRPSNPLPIKVLTILSPAHAGGTGVALSGHGLRRKPVFSPEEIAMRVRNAKGFTLIELLIVVAIIGII